MRKTYVTITLRNSFTGLPNHRQLDRYTEGIRNELFCAWRHKLKSDNPANSYWLSCVCYFNFKRSSGDLKQTCSRMRIMGLGERNALCSLILIASHCPILSTWKKNTYRSSRPIQKLVQPKHGFHLRRIALLIFTFYISNSLKYTSIEYSDAISFEKNYTFDATFCRLVTILIIKVRLEVYTALLGILIAMKIRTCYWLQCLSNADCHSGNYELGSFTK